MSEEILGTCAITASLGKETKTFTISFVHGIDAMKINDLTATIPADFFHLPNTSKWLEELFSKTTMEAADAWLLGDKTTHIGARPNGLSFYRRKQLDSSVRELLRSFRTKKGQLTWSVEWSGFDDYKTEEYESFHYGCINLAGWNNCKVYLVDSKLAAEDVAKTENLTDELTASIINSLSESQRIIGNMIALTSGNFIILMNTEKFGKENMNYSKYLSIIAHESFHLVMGICSDIGYNPTKEDEPAAYLLAHICSGAISYFCPELTKY